MKNYRRLSLEERIEIEKMREMKLSFSSIAKKLNRAKSTITREVKNYKYFNSYQASKANLRSYEKRLCKKDGKDKISANEKLKNYIHEKLKLRWSPDQISTTLKNEFPNDLSMRISHETIYLYIYVHCKSELKKELVSQLRQKRKRRGNFKTPAVLAPKIKGRVSIDDRPVEVLGREIPGHWEGDLIIGKNHESCIGTLAERTTRTILLIPLKNKQAETVRKGFEKAFKKLPKHMKKSLTYDNGTEMSEHQLFTKNTKVQVYFTHPYSP